MLQFLKGVPNYREFTVVEPETYVIKTFLPLGMRSRASKWDLKTYVTKTFLPLGISSAVSPVSVV